MDAFENFANRYMGEAVKFICLFVCLFVYNKKLPRKKIKFIKHIFFRVVLMGSCHYGL